VLLGFYRQELKRGITYPEALDEALASRMDRRRPSTASMSSPYTIRFTPRRRGSIWSAVNVKRVNELIALKAMRPEGIARLFEQRRRKKDRDLFL